MVKQKRGRPTLKNGEKRILIQVFIKKKNLRHATREIKAIARKYNTA